MNDSIMRSSYLEHNFGPFFQKAVQMFGPKRIVEFGLLDGYSTEYLLNGLIYNGFGKLDCFDLFEDFPFNRADYGYINKRFLKCKEEGLIRINKGDFYRQDEILGDQQIDMFHIDIANNGDTYDWFINNYFPKLSSNGIAMLEGGSRERDLVSWMIKYNKPPIHLVLEKLNTCSEIKYMTIEKFPSITILYRTGCQEKVVELVSSF
jgi:hypothetical protein